VLPPVRASAAAARHRLLPLLDGVLDREAQGIAVLLVSELVTNAITHAHAPITLAASVTPQRLRVEVNDSSPILPHVRELSPGSRGWGLHFLEELASRWGSQLQPGGKRVWFELDRHLPPARSG
jgi:anti-sigma regulatory factor (Ser/Thr protein kinase)